MSKSSLRFSDLSEHRSSKSKGLKKQQWKKEQDTHTNKRSNKYAHEQTKERKKQTSSVACFFWFDAMVGAIACGQTKQIKRQQASNHANQHKLMNFETGPAPQNPKATPRFAEVVAWFGRPQRGGVFFI